MLEGRQEGGQIGKMGVKTNGRVGWRTERKEDKREEVMEQDTNNGG